VQVVQAANLGLRFLLELSALAALGYWGLHAAPAWPARLGLGLGAPLLAAVVWGAFVAPRAAVPVPAPVRLLPEVAVFGAAAAALAAAGQPRLAAALALAAALNRALLAVWRQ
jgi:Protein of unknown function (DUF2568)